jgi:hypothetical protein
MKMLSQGWTKWSVSFNRQLSLPEVIFGSGELLKCQKALPLFTDDQVGGLLATNATDGQTGYLT